MQSMQSMQSEIERCEYIRRGQVLVIEVWKLPSFIGVFVGRLAGLACSRNATLRQCRQCRQERDTRETRERQERDKRETSEIGRGWEGLEGISCILLLCWVFFEIGVT